MQKNEICLLVYKIDQNQLTDNRPKCKTRKQMNTGAKLLEMGFGTMFCITLKAKAIIEKINRGCERFT